MALGNQPAQLNRKRDMDVLSKLIFHMYCSSKPNMYCSRQRGAAACPTTAIRSGPLGGDELAVVQDFVLQPVGEAARRHSGRFAVGRDEARRLLPHVRRRLRRDRLFGSDAAPAAYPLLHDGVYAREFALRPPIAASIIWAVCVVRRMLGLYTKSKTTPS